MLKFGMLMACVAFLCSAQVMTNMTSRVFAIRVPGGTATVFTLEVDGKQYLVTAKHVVAGLGEKGTVEIFQHHLWDRMKVEIFRCDEPVDIAIIIADRQISPALKVVPSSNEVMFGQEAYFLGFPFGDVGEDNALPTEHPLPFVKRAGVSTVRTFSSAAGEVTTLFTFDAYNNMGFSGSPIVFHPLPSVSHADPFESRVMGVVSGFKPDIVHTMSLVRSQGNAQVQHSEQWRRRTMPDGSPGILEDDKNSFVALNTGIMNGWAIEPAIALIKKHPTGPTVSAAFKY